MMKGSRILGVGAYTPPQVVTNDDLSKMMDTSDEWIQQRTGIKQRHWVDQKEATGTSDLALIATERALKNAGVKKEELDMIILGTLSPDHEFPGTACFLQAKLGISEIPALDIRQQCTAFIYGLTIADQFIKTGYKKRILVVGTEVHSKGLDKSTRGRDVTVLFGDGAGAMVVGPTEEGNSSRILSTHIHSDGAFAKELWLPYGGCAKPGDRITEENLKTYWQYPVMNGKAVFVHAVKRMPEAVLEALQANQMKIEDIDLFIFHQANLRINEMVAKQLNIPAEKVFNTIEKFGNTTAATIPIGFEEAIKAGKLKKGMKVLTAAFGSGFTWASGIVIW